MAARRRFRQDRAARQHRRACREAPRHRAGALHPGHAPHPLRRWRLERQPAAGRPGDARLDGEQLDGRAPVPAAQALRRGDAPRGAGGAGGRARWPGRRHGRRFQPPSGARRRRRRLCDLRAGRGGARAAASPERPAHGAQLFAAADDPQHHRRALHPGAGAQPSRHHPGTSALSRRRASHGPARRLSWRA